MNQAQERVAGYQTLAPIPENIPAELRALERWVCWKAESQTEKRPYCPTSGKLARINDPSTWTDFEIAWAAYQEDDEYRGLWLALANTDDIMVLDFDHVINQKTGELDQDVAQAVKDLRSYAEESPSGDGLHIVVRGRMPKGVSQAERRLQFWEDGRFIAFTGRTWNDDPIREVPPTLLEEVICRFNPKRGSGHNGKEYTHSERFNIKQAIKNILTGESLHETTRDVIARWVSKGVPPAMVLEMVHGIMDASQEAGSPRWEARLKDLGRMVESAIEKGYADSDWEAPIDLFKAPAPPPFPVHVLPAALGDYVEDQSDRIGVDPAILGMAGLCIAASAITDEIKIQPKRYDPSWTESARMWVAPVGGPSAKKTPAFKAMLPPVFDQESSWREQNAKAIAAFEDAKREAVTADVPFLEDPPDCHRAIINEITIEKLARVLGRTPRGTLTFKDELAGFLGGMDAYRENGTTKDRPFYLELYNGGPYLFDRVKEEVYIQNLGACVMGGIQPNIMRKFAGDLNNDGLLQRFHVFYAKDARRGHDRPRDRETFGPYAAAISALYQVTPGSRYVAYSPAARVFQERMESESLEWARMEHMPDGLRTHAGKWPGQFARLVLTFHAMECVAEKVHPSDKEVTESTASQVWTLFEKFLIPHAVAFYVDADVLADDVSVAMRNVAGFALSRNLTEVTRRELIAGVRELRRGKVSLDLVMRRLGDYGWVRPALQSPRQPTRWSVNPAIHQMFATQAEQERARRIATREKLLASISGGQGDD